MNLDIGCGNTPRGDINGDLFLSDTPHTQQIINKHKIPNFIRLDAENLPFRNNIFNIVYSYHCLEHLNNPKKALKEYKRVSKNKVIVRFPKWHFYNYMIESLGIIKAFIGIPFLKTTKHFISQIKSVKNWEKRYSVHLWYLNSKKGNKKINFKYFIPKEYEIVYEV